VALLAVLGPTLVPARAEESECEVPCDCSVIPQAGDWEYKRRTDRCEGLYGVPISNKKKFGIRLVSFTAGIGTLNVEVKQPIQISWPWVNLPMHVRSESTQRFYRMDTEVQRESRRFDWPVQLLKAVGIQPPEIAATVWIADGPKPIYVPARLCQTAPCAPASDYQAVFMTAYNADRLLVQVRDQHNSEIYSHELKQPIPRGKGIPFSLPREIDKPGRLTMVVTLPCCENSHVVQSFDFRTK
jgi:hypothetical protein